MSAFFAFAFDDRGVVFIHRDLLGLAEIGNLDVLELDAEIFRDGFAAGEGWRYPATWPCGGRRSLEP